MEQPLRLVGIPLSGPGRIAGWMVRRPALVLLVVAQALVALFAAALFAALAMPQVGASAEQDGERIVVALPDGGRLSLAEADPIVVAGGGDRLALPAASLLNDAVPEGGRVQVRRFYAGHDRLVRIVGARDATLAAPGREPVRLAPRHRRLADLPMDFWLLSLQGLAIGLLGVWMRANAGDRIAAWRFGASCDGILIAGLAGAVFDARELTASGTLLQAMQALNFIGTQVAAAGLLAMFLATPRRIAPWWVAAVLFVVAVLAGVLEGLGLLPMETFYWFLLATTVAAVPACLVQYHRTAGDPRARAVLRWIGATTVAGSALVTGGMAAPILAGVAPLASDGMTILPMAVVYGGIAFGFGGTRLFELERWTFRLALGGFAALGLLATDALLAGLLRLDQPVALAVALVAAGYGWLPLRAWLWQAIVGGRPQSAEDLFRQAAQVAFLDDPGERRQAWHRLLDRVFEPAGIAPLGEPVAAPALAGDGLELWLPALAGEGALRLSHARRGKGLFGLADLGTARELAGLIDAAEEARDAYVRGVNEERRRISRDLHDDVSALLLTALHRSSLADAHGDLNKALVEVRAMASSLAGRSQPLDAVLGDLRYETVGRLAAAGIVLDWPTSDLPGEEFLLGYACHKALTSALRETVTNVIRHSGASQMTVRAAIADGRIEIVAADNGRGLETVAGATAAGNGLGNMASRLREFGGSCTLEPRGHGLAVRLVLPLSGHGAAG